MSFRTKQEYPIVVKGSFKVPIHLGKSLVKNFLWPTLLLVYIFWNLFFPQDQWFGDTSEGYGINIESRADRKEVFTRGVGTISNQTHVRSNYPTKEKQQMNEWMSTLTHEGVHLLMREYTYSWGNDGTNEWVSG